MGLEYLNRRGVRYYVLQGTTKTGKPKYYCARKAQGVTVDELPAELEIHENPASGLVSVRKVIPSRILPRERELLDEMVRKLPGLEHFIIDVHGDDLTVFTSDMNSDESMGLVASLIGTAGTHAKSHADWFMRRGHYAPMFCFTLLDTEKRLFSVRRWCFRGSINGWLFLKGRQPLEVLAKSYLPDLGKESFYELM